MNIARRPRPPKLHARLSILTLGLGLVLMARQIYADDEPGAIPLLLVVVGIGWFIIARVHLNDVNGPKPGDDDDRA
jgi:hypothetical protein